MLTVELLARDRDDEEDEEVKTRAKREDDPCLLRRHRHGGAEILSD